MLLLVRLGPNAESWHSTVRDGGDPTALEMPSLVERCNFFIIKVWHFVFTIAFYTDNSTSDQMHFKK